MYVIRFDLRSPKADANQRSALYRTALEMASFVDEHGCGSIILSEHHVTSDGYLTSPLQMAAAVAAVTERTPITIAVAVLPFLDPVRLAEDLIMLDHLSSGRVMTVLGLGYRPIEYELYGVDFSERGRIADSKLEKLLELLADAGLSTDESDASTLRISPAPFTDGGPRIAWGGQSPAAARRAGRFGIGFFAQTNAPELRETYNSAAETAGVKRGFCFLPPPEAPYAVFVNEDIDQGWNDVGEALLADATAYQEWNENLSNIASFSASQTIADLRAENGAHRVMSAEQVRDLLARHGFVSFHPLCGGLQSDVAWPYLRRAVAAINET